MSTQKKYELKKNGIIGAQSRYLDYAEENLRKA
jgi:hypothetical protein